jgi:hypothetical protein
MGAVIICFKVLYQHLLWRAEENHKISGYPISSPEFTLGNSRIWSTVVTSKTPHWSIQCCSDTPTAHYKHEEHGISASPYSTCGTQTLLSTFKIQGYLWARCHHLASPVEETNASVVNSSQCDQWAHNGINNLTGKQNHKQNPPWSQQMLGMVPAVMHTFVEYL